MIRRENINFVASVYAPNPKEVSYWIDLKEGPDGQVIKVYVDNEWVKLNQNENEGQDEEITQLREDVDALEIAKADKSTTLSGYGITNAYTKTEVDGKINSKANSSDVYTKSQTDSAINTKVSALVDQAPETLDTLNELAAALGDDPNFATTIAGKIGAKADKTELANYATTSALTSGLEGKADAVHTHTVSQITDLNLGNYATTTALTEGLAGKANSTHTHTASQITDLDLSSYITGQGVSRIEVVTELPGAPEENVLYLIIAQPSNPV